MVLHLFNKYNKKFRFAMIVSVFIHIFVCLLLYQYIIIKKQKYTNNITNHKSTVNTFINTPKKKQGTDQSDRFKITESQRQLKGETTSNTPKKKQGTDQSDRFKITESQRQLKGETTSNTPKKKQEQNTTKINIPLYSNENNSTSNFKELHNLLNTLINQKNSTEKNTEFELNYTTKKNNDCIDSMNNMIKNDEINIYKRMISESIQRKFYNASNYTGKQCKLHVKLASNGTLLSITAISGDPDLCQAAIIATRLAKIPTPPNTNVHEIFKNIVLNFSPQ